MSKNAPSSLVTWKAVGKAQVYFIYKRYIFSLETPYINQSNGLKVSETLTLVVLLYVTSAYECNDAIDPYIYLKRTKLTAALNTTMTKTKKINKEQCNCKRVKLRSSLGSHVFFHLHQKNRSNQLD